MAIRILIAKPIRGGNVTLKGSQRKRDRRIFRKTSAPLSFIKVFRMNLISAGSILLDSIPLIIASIKNEVENKAKDIVIRLCLSVRVSADAT